MQEGQGGLLAAEWRGLKVPGHVDEVLAAVKENVIFFSIRRKMLYRCLVNNGCFFLKAKGKPHTINLVITPQSTIMCICLKFKFTAFIRYTTEICPLLF
jgi:hypothetical protein